MNKIATMFSILIFGVLLSSCSAVNSDAFPTSALEPKGPAAGNISELWWIMFGLGIAVFLLVSFLLLYAVFVRGRRTAEDNDHLQSGNSWILYGGLVLPTIVLVIVSVFTLRSMNFLGHIDNPTLTVQVVGHMWWWEVRYPQYGVITANEIHIPAGHTVEFQLTSADVIHSFWVPELQGKMDMIPGTTNTVQLQADEAGIYRGICTEFCGLQHAKMHFLVVAQTSEDFSTWLIERQQAAEVLMDDFALRGQEVFFETGCAKCHAISGTEAVSVFGPNLTHLAIRETLGAGVLPNNRGNLAGWVVNAQSVKPGSHMPPVDIPAEDLQALLAYLESLD